ncbi:hypothetical protein IscW_ISCW012543 [Ixodes scapularis]|uniref:Uncharacterized protein n=1 Tax=Ixodes scapularis TaxID=6945 RepID=B7QBW2_IXOSC|nr:hypothetical protein IscW_ISCW012543 [Ixodes scapularis]|eukprot:XP_002413026.1 hypothetical protein IscW_ISCW012543 [Ixodes scapularis]
MESLLARKLEWRFVSESYEDRQPAEFSFRITGSTGSRHSKQRSLLSRSSPRSYQVYQVVPPLVRSLMTL